MPTALRGYFPIMPTAFDEAGNVDVASMRRLTDFLIENGAHGMSPNGGDSECYNLNAEERKRITDAVVEQAAGRAPVLVGTSGGSTEESVLLSRYAEKAGASAVFVRPPANREDMPDDEMFAHYATVCECIRIPVMIHATGNMTRPFMERLVQALPNVQYIKEETDHGPKTAAYVRAFEGRVSVFGPGVSLMAELDRGIVGYMPSCCEPRLYAGVFDLWQSGDEEGARRQWNRLLPIIHWRWRTNSFEAGKEYLKHRGIFTTSYSRANGGKRKLDEYDLKEMLSILSVTSPSE